jgi:hypothetical protein
MRQARRFLRYHRWSQPTSNIASAIRAVGLIEHCRDETMATTIAAIAAEATIAHNHAALFVFPQLEFTHFPGK